VIVNINGQAFTPPSVSVQVGQRVIWRNNDVVAHTATANNGAFNTGLIAPGSQAGVTMNSAGTFGYFCAVHPNMTGTVSVSP
jgi:plastocyanin